MFEAKPTIYPTLVIGLGGSGANVVRYVKRRFLRTWRAGDQGDFTDLPAALQVLAVDTEPLVNPSDEEPLYSHEYAFLGKFDATRLVQNRQNHAPYLDWWQWDANDLPLGYIHNGARQLRPIGRLAFFRNYVTFKTLMTDKLRATLQLASIQEAEERGFPVAADHQLIYIVSSLCGGTGAGMFLDVAHRVRQEVGSNASVVGIFLMPSTFESEIRSDLQRRRIQANAYAALKELNHFHESQDFKALYPSEKTPMPTTKYRALDRIFLVERTNADGRTLSSKKQAEQMIAHLIHLMSMSHLNQRILGLDVNVTEERTTEVADSHQRYLSYSAFSTSALVMPQKALWRYFTSVASYWAIEALLTGEGGGEDPVEDQLWTEYLALRDALQAEFTRYQMTGEDLKALAEDVAQGDGRWLGFATIVSDAMRRLLPTYGLQGLRYMLHRLALAEDNAELVRDDLAHPRQLPFEEVGEVKRAGLIKQLFTSATELAETETARQKWLMFQSRLDAWRAVLGAFRALVRDWERQLDRVEEDLHEARDASVRHTSEAAERVHPLRRQGDDDTNTYYDLETGAVNEEMLSTYIRVTAALLDKPVSEADGAITRWRLLSGALCDYVFAYLTPENTRAGTSVSASTLRAALEQRFAEDPDLATLRQELTDAFDLRNVVQAQQDGDHRPANYRLSQLFKRMAPHLSVDGDTFPYTEANEEHVRVVATPSALAEEVNTAFRQAMRGYDDFEWVPTGDANRIDACHIVHGLPLVQLRSMPDLYKHYAGGEFDRRTLHVQADWADFPEVYAPAASADVLSELALEQARTPRRWSPGNGPTT
ncbi:MAG: hypothetical protein QG637_151 [Chloroflexota bacterium]|nr:hypothetical protein [Chloroflexota bacterium]